MGCESSDNNPTRSLTHQPDDRPFNNPIRVTTRVTGDNNPVPLTSVPLTRRDFVENPELKNVPIIKYVKRVSCHTDTVRFDTYNNYRSFNSVYVPNSFLEGNEDVKILQVVVKWN